MQNITQVMDLMETDGGQNQSKTVKSDKTNLKNVNFKKILSKQTSNVTTKDSANPIIVKKENATVQVMNGKVQEQLQNTIVDDTLSQNIVDGTVTKENVQDYASGWISQVKQQLCQEFGVDEEQLDDLMSQLGLQFADLLNIQNLQQFVLAQSGSEDATVLLTDENLGQKFQNTMQVLENITEIAVQESGLSPQMFQDAVKDFETISPQDGNVMTETEQSREAVLVKADKSVDAVVVKETDEIVSEGKKGDTTGSEERPIQDIFQEQLQEQPNKNQTVVTEEKPVKNEKQETQIPVETNEKVQIEEPETVTDTEEMQSPHTILSKQMSETENGTGAFDQRQEDSSSNEQPKMEKPLFDHVVTNTTTSDIGQVEMVNEKVEVIQQFREVVEQVVTQIKVMVSEDTSEMTMQLNPESLGKVNLSVVTKQSHITAQFVTENEVARQALESQVQQLRETLGQQGLKVDKVEVSVSDFNFNQGNETNAEEQKEQQRKGYAKQLQKNLNIKDLDGLDGLSEREQLAIKIMQSNGNQIDYTA